MPTITMRRERLYRALVSTFVAFVLAAQIATIPVTATHGTYLRDRGFPVLEYPMYAPAHYEGERVIASWLIEGVLENGQSISITKEMLQVDIFDFVRIVEGVLADNENSTQALWALIRSHVPEANQIREIRIKNYPLRVTRDGPVPDPSEVVKTLPFPAA